MKRIKGLAVFAVAALTTVIGLSAFAGTYNSITYYSVSSKDEVQPGRWYKNFKTVKAYADENHVPMVLFWGNKGCGHCADVENSMGKSKDFKKWMEESGIVFVFVVSGVTEGAASAAKIMEWAQSGSDFPFIRYYWNTGDARGVVGKKYSGNGWSAKTVKSKAVALFKDWTPEKGGEFNFTESEGNRYEIEAGSTGVEVALTRRPTAVKDAYENTIEVIMPDGTIVSNKLAWSAGQSSTNLTVALPDLTGLKAGDTVKIRMDGNDKNVLNLNYVEVENSAANPLWDSERKAPAAKKALKALGAGAQPKELDFGEWTMDIRTAKALARAKDGYVLVAALGSLWCHDCANTDRNFLDMKDGGVNIVQAWAKEKKVALVSMDIPGFTTNVAGQVVANPGRPCLLTRTAIATQLAYELPAYDFYDVSQGGAPESLAAKVVRSGLSYQTRKGITEAEAAAKLEEFKTLITTDTAKDGTGGFHRPEDSSAFGFGVPSFVLLDKNGVVKARLTRFASKSPYMYKADGKTLIATPERTRNILKRFEEMIAIADAAEGTVDASEIGNNNPSEDSAVVANGGAPVAGRIGHADWLDTFKIDGVTGNIKESVTVTGASDAEVTVQFMTADAEGKAVAVGEAKKAKLSDGITLTNEFAGASASCYVKVSADNPAGSTPDDSPFSVYSAASTAVDFTVAVEKGELLPAETPATVAASDGDTLKIRLEKGQKYRFKNIKEPDPALFEVVGDFYTVTNDFANPVEIKVAGDFTYQKWVPGEVGFRNDQPKSVKETCAGWTVSFGRSGGLSGDVKVRVYVDREATDYFYDLWPEAETDTYKQLPRFSIDGSWDFLPADLSKTFETNFVYAEGADLASCSNSFQIGFEQVAELKKYYGDGKIVLKLEFEDAAGEKGEDEYVINVTETSSSKPGTVYVKGAAPFFAKSYTVYAFRSNSVDITLARAKAMEGAVRTRFTQSKGGALLLSGDSESSTNAFTKAFEQWWWNHDDEDKVITVTNLPAAGKSVTLTLSPVKPFKINSKSSRSVKIVSVADDATAFEQDEYAFTNLIRYVACSCSCPLKAYGKGISLALKKLSGSIPSGVTAKVLGGTEESGRISLVFSGAPAKAGTYTAVYQLVENRGTTKKAKNVAGMPVRVTFTVVDPVTAGASTDPAVQAIANPAVASTRTLSDLMVWNSNSVDRLAGKVTVTIPRTGKVSAKYVGNAGTIAFGTKSWAAKTVGEEDADGTLRAVLTPTKSILFKEKYQMTLSAFADGSVKIEVLDPAYEGTVFEAYSNGKVWTAGNAKKKIPAHTAADWKGYYTVSLVPAGTMVATDADPMNSKPLPGVITEKIPGLAPRGCGYLTLKMNASKYWNAGKMVWAGKLPNGTAVSGTTVLTEEWAADPEDPEWKPTYAYLPIFTRVSKKVSKKQTTLDSLSEILKIKSDAATCIRAVTPAEELARGQWRHVVTKPLDLESDHDFSMDIFGFGSYFDAKKHLAACCAESNVELVQGLVFEGAIPSVEISVVTNKTVSKETIKITTPAAENKDKVTLKFNRSTGVVTGTFKMPYNDGVKSATWQGVILSGWGCSCGGCWVAPPELELDKVFLPFVSGGYIFADTVPFVGGAPLSVTRGGQVKSLAIPPMID